MCRPAGARVGSISLCWQRIRKGRSLWRPWYMSRSDAQISSSVPPTWTVDVSGALENQIERFAPGFRDRVLAQHVSRPTDLEVRNPNLVGGDITGGAQTPRQLAFRPVVAINPYRTPADGVYLCSASTPPGGGVHGMCGVHAARTVLRDLRR